MVLLKGLNYDFGQRQNTKLATVHSPGVTSLQVQNTTGFANNDYVLIDPFTDEAEIVQITAVVSSNISFTISATKFAHEKNAKVYVLPYNQMRFYSATDYTGTYSLITTTSMTFDQEYTDYMYAAGTSLLYYKRTFYNSTTLVESDIAVADYWQTSDEYHYITANQLRVFLQFDSDDVTPQDMLEFIDLAESRIRLDTATSNVAVLKIATLLLARYYIMKALAAKAVSKGYIIATAEGRTITKAHTELLKDAKEIMAEYTSFIAMNTSNLEATRTNFMADSTLIDPDTRTSIVDRYDGLQNALDYENNYRFSYGFRQRRR